MKKGFHMLFVSVILCSCVNNGSISGVAIEKTMNELQRILKEGHKWEKVHAAEFLLALGYNDNVYETFRSELLENGHVPQYRIGIWRVLYRSAKTEEKQKWSDSIYNVFIDPSAPDRIHAAETLAKLKIPKQDKDSSIIGSTLASDISPLWFYTNWWIIPQLENGTEELKKFLFDILQSKQDDYSPIRPMAAYIIREDKISLTEEEWQTLRSIIVSEPEGSQARAVLAVAAFSTAPDRIPQAQQKEIENILSGCKDLNTYQYCLAYAENGKTGDVEMLTRLLDSENEDIKNAAAYAILRIDQRNNQKSK